MVRVAGEGLRSVGVEALPSSKSVCSILPLARHLRAGASYGVPALSFASEALKRVGRAPSTFGSRPGGGHFSNVVGTPQPSLLESRAPLCEEGSTIDSSLSWA